MTRVGLATVAAIVAVGLVWVPVGAARDGAGFEPPPGAAPFDTELAARLREALAAQGPEYEPRTHHFDDDGSPKYTNRLILESSPYLLQHAHNPVNWFPWGEEAFALARELGRPVLLSVGYSTCHWCHVMERESFEDEEIARYLNQHYIAIKVDREERPDIDSIYMTAVQLLTRHGGWPMTVWLTPDGEPFHGATYLPPRDGDRGVQRGFLSVLQLLRSAWDDQRDGVMNRADQLSTAVRESLAGLPATTDAALPSADLIATTADHYRQSFDAEHGGLNRAPKFPSSMSIRLLLRAWQRTGEAAYLEMATLTLEKMAAGGLFDQVGGGFHRYSTDARWLVPHFEKMLYDNAQLVVAYLEAYQATGNEAFAGTARRVLDYVRREMTSPGGGFYSATDADSPTPEGHSEEGWFFTWTPAEIEAVVGPEEARVVAAAYGVTPAGNFEGRNILFRERPAADVAAALGLSEIELENVLRVARTRLYAARSERPPPLLDDKILTAWNGLMISAFAVAGQVLDEPEYTLAAERAAAFVLGELREDGRLRRTWRAGRAGQAGFLDDYAFLIAGLIDLHQATFDTRWLEEAIALQAVLDADYADPTGGYFLTGAGHETLLAREKPTYDGAEPSGNSVALTNLVRLAELTTDDTYRERADRLLRTMRPLIERAPTGFADLQVGLDYRLSSPKEIVLVAPTSRAEAAPFLEILRRRFLPRKIVVVAVAGSDLESQQAVVPFLEGKIPRQNLPTAYVCERFVCQLPTTDLAVFERQLVDEGPEG